MWRCKQVADALAGHHYGQLPWLKRAGLKFHVAVCLVCGRYHRQVMLMQELVGRFARNEETGALPPVRHLDETAKARMKEAVKKAGGGC